MKSSFAVVLLASFFCSYLPAGTLLAPCSSTANQSMSMDMPVGATVTVVCPQFQPQSGYSLTGVRIGDVLGNGPFTTGGTITVRSNLPSSSGPYVGTGLVLVQQELAYLDFPGMPTTSQLFPVLFANPLTFTAGETIVAPVSTVWTWPLLLFTDDPASLNSYLGSGTISSRVTGNSRLLSPGGDFSVLDL